MGQTLNLETTKVWGNLLGGTIGKFILGGVGIIGVAAVIYILVLQGQVKDRDLRIVTQQATIQAQASRIEALDLQWKLTVAANETLNERLKVRQLQIDNLNYDIQAIYSQGAENDGPVAPVLDSIVRAPVRTRP